MKIIDVLTIEMCNFFIFEIQPSKDKFCIEYNTDRHKFKIPTSGVYLSEYQTLKAQQWAIDNIHLPSLVKIYGLNDIDITPCCDIRDILKESETSQEYLKECVTGLTIYAHEIAKACGWWENRKGKEDIPLLLMLAVSELVEAFEGYRKGLPDDHLPHQNMFDTEIVDLILRIFDTAGGLKINVAEILLEKLLYNIDREDHKPENRSKPGGKKY